MQKNKNSGITMIALIVTIIVLLILASVTISIFMNNGIIDKIKLAKAFSANSTNEENEKLGLADNIIADYEKIQDEIVSPDQIEFTPSDSNWKVNNVKAALDYLYNN